MAEIIAAPSASAVDGTGGSSGSGVEYDESWSRSSNSKLLPEAVVGEPGSFKVATGGSAVDCSSRTPLDSSNVPSGGGG